MSNTPHDNAVSYGRKTTDAHRLAQKALHTVTSEFLENVPPVVRRFVVIAQLQLNKNSRLRSCSLQSAILFPLCLGAWP